MKSYRDRLVAEIDGQLDELARTGDPWVAQWVAHDICNDHRDALPEMEGSEFWLWSTYQFVRDQVRRQINKRAGDTAEPRERRSQLVLQGFERDHLQDYYMVVRDEKEQGIPVTMLTDAEIDAKAGQYRAMGAACYAHADELERFKFWRRNAQQA